MILIFPLFGLTIMIIFYFKFMIDSRWIETNFIYYSKHLLKKKSKLNIVYFRRECNMTHPHLKLFALLTLINFFLVIILLLISCIALLNGIYDKDNIFFTLSAIIVLSIFIGMVLCLIISQIQVRECEKQMELITQNEMNIIKNNIEKEWDNFFTISK